MSRGIIRLYHLICIDHSPKLTALTVILLVFGGAIPLAAATVEVPQFAVYELRFIAGTTVEHPFDQYLLKLVTVHQHPIFVRSGRLT